MLGLNFGLNLGSAALKAGAGAPPGYGYLTLNGKILTLNGKTLMMAVQHVQS